jgi:hypothetical protein
MYLSILLRYICLCNLCSIHIYIHRFIYPYAYVSTSVLFCWCQTLSVSSVRKDINNEARLRIKDK